MHKTFRILAVFAHPDDEAFGTGGTLSRYAKAGQHVYLVCATRGEVGEISDPQLASPETLGTVREAELRCAAETMGVRELVFLNYRDSGMKGSPDNDHPRAFINAPDKTVVGQLIKIIQRIKPDIVLTFEPNGGYGHPDHIAIHRHTLAAFHAAGDDTQFPRRRSAWKPGRLFYTAIPRSFFLKLRAELFKLSEDTSDIDSMLENGMGWPDAAIDVALDVSSSVEAKWQALECHRTQFGPKNLFRRLPKELVLEMMSTEHFSLAYPDLEGKLNDLLDGLE